jgi:hypothetical protein
MLRSLDIDVYTIARRLAPHPATSIVTDSGGHYLSRSEHSVSDLVNELPNVDIILEATGDSEPVFASMSLLGINGVLVLLSGTSGDRTLTVPASAINRGFVGGNKLMVGSVNSNYVDFVTGVARLATIEQRWPGLASRLITARLNAYDHALSIRDAGGIKAVLEFGT